MPRIAKPILTLLTLLAVALLAATLSRAAHAPATQPAAAKPTPLIYKDAKTGIILYVETNRHILSAIDPEGKILWHQDMAERAFGHGGRFYTALQIDTVMPLAQAMAGDARVKGGDLATIHFSFGNTQAPGRHDDRSGGVIDLKTGAYTELYMRTTNTLQ